MEESDVRKGIPVYIDDREPEIDNPLGSSESHYWYPANSISIKLMACLEAMRDIHKFLEMLSQGNNATDKRIHKLLTTPVFSLARGVEKLFNDIEGNAKEYGQITAKQQREIKKRFVRFSKEVPLQKDDDLRIIRDKLGAHVDDDVFLGDGREIWKLVDIDALLEWIKATFEALMSLLELDIFAWSRDSGNPDIFRLMSVYSG